MYPLETVWIRRPDLEEAICGEVRKRPGIIQLTGVGGSGKTSLLRRLRGRLEKEVGEVVRHVYARDFYELHVAQYIWSDEVLLVIDNFDEADTALQHEIMSRIGGRRITAPTIIVGRNSTKFADTVINVPEFSQREIHDLVNESLGVRSRDFENIFEYIRVASQGNPASAKLMLSRFINNGTISDISNLLRPFHATDLIGLDGKPLRESKNGQVLITDIKYISDEFIKVAARDPKTLHEISPRQFEMLVADIFNRKGYEVELTKQTRDGGKDIYAVRKDDIGEFLYVIECKRYSPENSVDVGVVRSLHGVADAERATAGIVVTTSTFTSDAKKWVSDYKLERKLSLKDYIDIREWLNGLVAR